MYQPDRTRHLGIMVSPRALYDADGEQPSVRLRGGKGPQNAELYERRSFVEMDVLHVMGLILDRPFWWTQWPDPDVREAWIHEAQDAYVNRTLYGSLGEWPIADAFWLYMQPLVEKLMADATSEELRDALLAQRFSSVRLASMDTEDSDSDDHRIDPFGEIAFYFLQTAVWMNAQKKILAGQLPVPAPVAAEAIEALRSSFTLIKIKAGLLGTGFLKAMLLSSEPSSVERIQQHLRGRETRVPVLLRIQAYCDQIQAQLYRLRMCIVSTLDAVIDREELTAEKTSNVPCPGPLQETWISDGILSEPFKRKLSQEVTQLEAVYRQQQWNHSHQDEVLNLVDPSLHCIVFGKSRGLVQLPNEQEMNARKLFLPGKQHVLTNPIQDHSYASFQWLPAEFQVDTTGRVKIRSYINNLHPDDFAPLYDSIATVFERFVPLFDRVLQDLTKEITEFAPQFTLPPIRDRPTFAYPERPQINEQIMPSTSESDLTLKGSTAQIIVELTKICLESKSSYNISTRHAKYGHSETEAIVATGIYFFDFDNINQRCPFTAFDMHVSDTQDEFDDRALLLPTMDDPLDPDLLIQELPSISIREGRAMVFANTLEYELNAVRLKDSTKPGSCIMLTFYLVHPGIRIPSSASVSAQQQEWIERAQMPVLKSLRLPEELKARVQAFAADGLTPDDALDCRFSLVNERYPYLDAFSTSQ